MKIVILGLSITSSWGNGHATTYRSLIGGWPRAGTKCCFWSATLPGMRAIATSRNPPGAKTELYNSLDELIRNVRSSSQRGRPGDRRLVRSRRDRGRPMGHIAWRRGVTAFYDIDTPVTLAKLRDGTCEYMTRRSDSRATICIFRSPAARRSAAIEQRYGSPMARALYCSVDTGACICPCSGLAGGIWAISEPTATTGSLARPLACWSPRALARGTVCRGGAAVSRRRSSGPPTWSATIHLSPREHPAFYGSQRFTLNITREAMKRPATRPACGCLKRARAACRSSATGGQVSIQSSSRAARSCCRERRRHAALPARLSRTANALADRRGARGSGSWPSIRRSARAVQLEAVCREARPARLVPQSSPRRCRHEAGDLRLTVSSSWGNGHATCGADCAGAGAARASRRILRTRCP